MTLRFEKVVALNSEGRINGALTSTKVATNASSGIVVPGAQRFFAYDGTKGPLWCFRHT